MPEMAAGMITQNLLILAAWESSRGQPKALGPCTCVGYLEEASGSWLQISSALAVVTTWGSEPADR